MSFLFFFQKHWNWGLNFWIFSHTKKLLKNLWVKIFKKYGIKFFLNLIFPIYKKWNATLLTKSKIVQHQCKIYPQGMILNQWTCIVYFGRTMEKKLLKHVHICTQNLIMNLTTKVFHFISGSPRCGSFNLDIHKTWFGLCTFLLCTLGLNTKAIK